MAGVKSKPFVVVAATWGITGLVVSIASGVPPLESAKWMTGLWLLSVIDLFALTRAVAAVVSLVSSETDEVKPALYVQTLVWGAVKLGCLGVFIAVLFAAGSSPAVPLLMGLGTLVVVPLAGGWFWSRGVSYA